MYSDRRGSPLLQETGVTEANVEGQIFDWTLINRRFCACAVKNRPKIAYCVVKSPQF